MTKRLKRLRRRLRAPLVAFAMFALVSVVARLPRHWLAGLAGVVGRALFAVPAVGRLMLTNLAIAFPDKAETERRVIGGAATAGMLLTFFEFIWFARHPEQLRAAIDVSAPEADAVFTTVRQQGAFFMSPHVGNWELGAQLMAASGVSFGAVARKIKNPYLDRLVARARTYHGQTIIPEHGAVRLMVKAIKSGTTIGILIDQNTRPSDGGVFVPFFGLPAPVSRAPAALALKFKIPILCVVLVRENGRLCLRSEPLPKPVDQYADDLELTAALMQLNERMVRRYPEQYMWYYERWRYIPPGASAAVAARFPAYGIPWQEEASSE